MSDAPEEKKPRGTIVIDRHDDPDVRPTRPPRPEFPHGCIMDCSAGAAETCDVELPYPARGVGGYAVACNTCGISIALTVAGRPDDPRRIILPCGRRLRHLEKRAHPP